MQKRKIDSIMPEHIMLSKQLNECMMAMAKKTMGGVRSGNPCGQQNDRVLKINNALAQAKGELAASMANLTAIQKSISRGVMVKV